MRGETPGFGEGEAPERRQPPVAEITEDERLHGTEIPRREQPEEDAQQQKRTMAG